jgi:hypothetical protein
MNVQTHFFHTQTAPPNVNGNFCAATGGLDELGGGGTHPCAIQGYTNIIPSYYTFDLSSVQRWTRKRTVSANISVQPW